MTPFRFRPRTIWIVAAALALAVSAVAPARQYLVRPGEDWDALAPRLKPGDQVLLMPGRHKPARFDALRGTAKRPIVIRGADPDNPPLIVADRYGLRIGRPLHVAIRNLEITGASIRGISLEGRAATDTALAEDLPSAFVRIENVTITATGPGRTRSQRDAIGLEHVDDVDVAGCRFAGWAGTGVEIVGGREIRVRECIFDGDPEYAQIHGVRVRAGAASVRIERCTFTNLGDQSVCVGASSELAEFDPAPTQGAEPGTLFEASRVRVTQCLIRGGQCAVALVNCHQAIVRNCTIVRPQLAVISVRHEQRDARFAGLERCAFGSNLVTWQPGDVTSLAHIGRDADPEGLILEENLWWAPDLAETLETLGPFPGHVSFAQVVDVDPGLDDRFRPSNRAARAYGPGLALVGVTPDPDDEQTP